MSTITLWICVLVLWIHKDNFVVKNWSEMLYLKLSGIQLFVFNKLSEVNSLSVFIPDLLWSVISLYNCWAIRIVFFNFFLSTWSDKVVPTFNNYELFENLLLIKILIAHKNSQFKKFSLDLFSYFSKTY